MVVGELLLGIMKMELLKIVILEIIMQKEMLELFTQMEETMF